MSNGEAERAVQTVKSILKKGGDPYLALLAYRTTPLHNGYSPSELLMNSSTLPITREARRPIIPNHDSLVEKEEELRKKRKDRRHRAKELPVLLPGEDVR